MTIGVYGVYAVGEAWVETQSGSSHVWQAVGAGATATAALVALAAYLWPHSGASGTASAPLPSHPTAANAPQIPTSPSVPDSSRASSTSTQATSTVLAQATLHVSELDGSGVDVGSLPLTISTNGVSSFWAGGGEIHAGVAETTVIAAWSGPE